MRKEHFPETQSVQGVLDYQGAEGLGVDFLRIVDYSLSVGDHDYDRGVVDHAIYILVCSNPPGRNHIDNNHLREDIDRRDIDSGHP